MAVLLSLAVLALLVGLFIHFFVDAEKHPRLWALGSGTYLVGLFVFLLQSGPELVNLLGGG